MDESACWRSRMRSRPSAQGCEASAWPSSDGGVAASSWAGAGAATPTNIVAASTTAATRVRQNSKLQLMEFLKISLAHNAIDPGQGCREHSTPPAGFGRTPIDGIRGRFDILFEVTAIVD